MRAIVEERKPNCETLLAREELKRRVALGASMLFWVRLLEIPYPLPGCNLRASNGNKRTQFIRESARRISHCEPRQRA